MPVVKRNGRHLPSPHDLRAAAASYRVDSPFVAGPISKTAPWLVNLGTAVEKSSCRCCALLSFGSAALTAARGAPGAAVAPASCRAARSRRESLAAPPPPSSPRAVLGAGSAKVKAPMPGAATMDGIASEKVRALRSLAACSSCFVSLLQRPRAPSVAAPRRKAVGAAASRLVGSRLGASSECASPSTPHKSAACPLSITAREGWRGQVSVTPRCQ